MIIVLVFKVIMSIWWGLIWRRGFCCWIRFVVINEGIDFEWVVVEGWG